jgi:hypothetical protein
MNQYPILNFTTDTLTVLAGNSRITGSLYLKGAIASNSASTLSGTVTVDNESALNIGGYPTETFLTETTSNTFFSSGSTGIGNLGGNLNVFGLGSNTDDTPVSGSGIQFLSQWRGIYGADQAYNVWMGHTYEDGDSPGLLGPVFVINGTDGFTDRATSVLLKYRHSDNNLFIGDQNYGIPLTVRGDGVTISTDGGSELPQGSDTVIVHGNVIYLEGVNLQITGSEYISANLDALPILGGGTLRMVSYDSASGQIGTSLFPVANNGGIQSETDPVFTSVRYTLASTGSNSFRGNQTITGSLTVSGSNITLISNPVISGSLTVSSSINGAQLNGSSYGYAQLYYSQSGVIAQVNASSSYVYSGYTSSLGNNEFRVYGNKATSLQPIEAPAFSGSFSGSYVGDGSGLTNLNVPVNTFATTGSNSFKGSQDISGSLIASGSEIRLHSDNITLTGALNLNASVLTSTTYVPNLSLAPTFYLAAYQPLGLGTDLSTGYVPLTALNLNSGSLGNTNVTGSLIVSQSGINVIGTSNTLGNSSITGSLTVSGSLSTFNYVSGTLITPTGSFTTSAPSFAASEGQFLFGSGSRGYAMFVYIGGAWRSSSLS